MQEATSRKLVSCSTMRDEFPGCVGRWAIKDLQDVWVEEVPFKICDWGESSRICVSEWVSLPIDKGMANLWTVLFASSLSSWSLRMSWRWRSVSGWEKRGFPGRWEWLPSSALHTWSVRPKRFREHAFISEKSHPMTGHATNLELPTAWAWRRDDEGCDKERGLWSHPDNVDQGIPLVIIDYVWICQVRITCIVTGYCIA